MNVDQLHAFFLQYQIWFLTWPLWAPVSMLVWYAVGIQYERGGAWKAMAPVTFLGFLYDVLLQYTLFQIYFWEVAPRHEFTISMRLGRLLARTDWRGRLARWLADILNRLAPSGRHI